MNYSKIEQLVGRLSGPLYQWRMAHGYSQKVKRLEIHPNIRMTKSARTQERNAAATIDKIVREYVETTPFEGDDNDDS
jgi:hypothetical protein